MPSDEVVENAWTRARCTCECDHATHAHAARCGTALVWEHRGMAVPGGWETVTNGPKGLAGWHAVQASRTLCWSCYQKATNAARKQVPADPGATDAHHPDRR